MAQNRPYSLILAVTGIIFLIGIISVTEGKNEALLVQYLDVLKGSSGRIVEQKPIDVESTYKDSVECYRIKYLSDGLKVVGFVLKPKNKSSKLPVIIFNRGGNREYGKITNKTLMYLSYLSSNSYVVLASQYRGNDGGQGKEQFGGKDVNDVLNLVPLAKSIPFADPNKIGMLGYSRGGMMTYLAVKNSAKINAACIVGGITDLIQTYRERGDKMKEILEELVGGPPKTKKIEYESRSAYYWPEKINVPVLILHGEDDWRVKVSQAEKLAAKLDELGKTHELDIYSEGDHGLNTHRLVRNKRIFEWFEKYLH